MNASNENSGLEYEFFSSESGILVELYLPKKTYFQGRLYNTLTLYDPACGKHFGEDGVKKCLKEKKKRVTELMRRRYTSIYELLESDYEGAIDKLIDLKFIGYRGYSMYEVDGVFFGAPPENDGSQIAEERTQVIRLIFLPDMKKLLRKIMIDQPIGGNEIEALVKRYVKRPGTDKERVGEDFRRAMNTIAKYCLRTPIRGEKSITAVLKIDPLGPFERAVEKRIDEWIDSVGFFLFAYIVDELCREIKTPEKLEDEIWVTSFWHFTLNRLLPFKREPGGDPEEKELEKNDIRTLASQGIPKPVLAELIELLQPDEFEQIIDEVCS